MSTIPVGTEPSNVVCPTCRQQILTRVESKASTKTHLIALILCILGCCPCACCLYCTKCARNVEHYCPSCNAFIGVYEK
ncbi:lipopolysaccharide-induced tumor necrosis factor-alpha factor homolog [Episyrphus balteatus]|uniref:lipopolysaccharide-induced tumor necrosis factor-alpha factor homolog n=1 Tax=Episyrphus balteatus TaxID=286459 RepID=UPI002485AFED|nr:lipopolysaccharide-induced tumor necrosis factor-alpha factor homolog [Episyrphus balteatus]